MDIVDQQFADLRKVYPKAQLERISNGSALIEIPEFELPPGWNVPQGTVVFLLPPGYPSAQPDCFWLEPLPIRLTGGATPQASNDANPIPGVGQRGTWFSWHLQAWHANSDTILTYVNVIKQRLFPAR